MCFRILALVIATAICGLGQSISAQSLVCSPHDLTAQLLPDYRAYADAMDLERELRRHDIKVRCVLRSKMEGFFEDQLGGALYRTDHGDFEALFLPEGRDFNDLVVINEREGDRYLYELRRGSIQHTPIDSPRPMYFLSSGRRLLVTSDLGTEAMLWTIVSN